jgi:integrase
MSLFLPRPGELRAAEWAEFKTPKMPYGRFPVRIKLNRAHKLPPSRQALVVLSDLRRITGNGRTAFPSLRTITKSFGKHVKCNLRRLGYVNGEGTSRGFSASAATLLNETGRWNADAIERQLAHMLAASTGTNHNNRSTALLHSESAVS